MASLLAKVSKVQKSQKSFPSERYTTRAYIYGRVWCLCLQGDETAKISFR